MNFRFRVSRFVVREVAPPWSSEAAKGGRKGVSRVIISCSLGGGEEEEGGEQVASSRVPFEPMTRLMCYPSDADEATQKGTSRWSEGGAGKGEGESFVRRRIHSLGWFRRRRTQKPSMKKVLVSTNFESNHTSYLENLASGESLRLLPRSPTAIGDCLKSGKLCRRRRKKREN